MKVIGIVGSPRLGGNTQVLVEESLQAAREQGAEVELYLVAQKSIAPCDGCEICQQTRECCIQDDMQELHAKLVAADGIIVGSPVYFWSVSAQTKAIIDRTFAFRPDRRLKNKVGGAIVVGRRRGLSHTATVLTSFFTAHHVAIAGVATALGDERGDVRRDSRGMEEARRVGTAMVALMRAGQPAR